MYQPPFHRRILPWLYVAVFLATAPLLIFYTAGYRYNPKKQQIERSGTLIVDTFPKGAHIYLDGHDTQEISPITFQNISPGWHELRLTKNGYHPWQNNVNIRAEQVSFANNVWLWRESTSTLLREGNFNTIRTDPTNSRSAMIFQGASSSQLALWTPETGWHPHGNIPRLDPTKNHRLRWRDDGQAFVIDGLSGQESAWWGTIRDTVTTNDALPEGTYYWSQHELLGSNDRRSFRLDPDRNTFARDILSTSTISLDRNITLETTSTSPNLLLTYQAFQKHNFSLPFGNWRMGTLRFPYILLHDTSRWLSVTVSGNRPRTSVVTGDLPRWLAGANPPLALFLHQNEVWSWRLGKEPNLL